MAGDAAQRDDPRRQELPRAGRRRRRRHDAAAEPGRHGDHLHERRIGQGRARHEHDRAAGGCPTGSTIIDFVGYGAADCSETSPAAGLTNTTSDQRKGGGATDTNNNANDFTAGAPDPHPSVDAAPSVATTTPAAGSVGASLDSNITIGFNEPVNVTGSWFTISCATSGAHTAAASGGPVTFTLDPATNFAPNELCTVTIVAANVTDQDTDDPPDQMAANKVFTFTTADVLICGGAGATKIHDVQGNGNATPAPGSGRHDRGHRRRRLPEHDNRLSGYFLEQSAADFDADPAT